MGYLPKLYPKELWWSGKLFIAEAQAIVKAIPNLKDDPGRMWVLQRLIERGICVALGLPVVLSEENTKEHKELKRFLPDGFPWQKEGNDPKYLLEKAEQIFFRIFYEQEYDEYCEGQGFEDKDIDWFMDLLEISESEAEEVMNNMDIDVNDSRIDVKLRERVKAVNEAIDEEIDEEIYDYMKYEFDGFWKIHESGLFDGIPNGWNVCRADNCSEI